MTKKYYTFLIILLTSTISFHSQSISEILENSLSSVVTVAVYEKSYAKKSLGFRGEKVSDIAYKKALDMAGAVGSGSGFAIQRNGKKFIITNAHVIEIASDNPGSIYVFTINRNKYEVKIVGGDSFYDIAVLEFVDQPGSELTTIDFKKEESRIGETVYAIGNPLGEYPYSVTNGIISAKNRVRGGRTGKFGFLQTTATVIWGNSGGPLVDVNGKVAGINSQIAFATAPDGTDVWQSQINFALEAGIAEKIVDDILKYDGRVVRSYFGLELSQKYTYEYTGDGEFDYVLQDEFPILTGVIPNSPAAGNLDNYTGYNLLSINNTEIQNIEEALGELEKILPNQETSFILSNGYDEKTVKIIPIELKTYQLENIAKYVIDKDQEIDMDINSQQVIFTRLDENIYKYEEEKFSKYGSSTTSSSSSSSSEQYQKVAGTGYYVLAAGIYNDDYQDMWRIEDHKDLGAALKICGLAGTIDFYMLEEGKSEDDIELYRQYLSGDENIWQPTLWY
ncbi:MAG: serine protease [Bacteroidales bacterium]|nr:serine protease [Bacteroidales bacterium]